MRDDYNGLGQVTAEYQSHAGAVNIAATPAVRYSYLEMAARANSSRPESMTYPNGGVLYDNYGYGLNQAIDRLFALKDGSGISNRSISSA